MPQAAVVIPNWNGARLLNAFLPSVLTACPGARLVVVDNGSGDDSAEAARRLGAEVIANQTNRGFAAAVNQGVAETDEPLVAVVNNDVRLGAGWLDRLTEALNRSGAQLACGTLFEERRPEMLDGTYDLISRGGTAWRAGSGYPAGEFPGEPSQVRFVSLTAALIRREAFERAGPLDEDFESYLEDVEFALRCARLGLTAVYEPAAQAWHRGSATLGRWHPRTARLIARNQLMLVAKHFPSGWWTRPVLAAQLLWVGVAARHGQFAAALDGKREGIAGFRRWRAASSWARRNDDVEALLAASEAEIARLQQAVGPQDYWKWYFRLAGRA